ncbi:tail fiber domain-containing protein [Burkholderia sp. B21-007]|uniref:tail fiber domain-containing protein n=1 Tax=Burkholderia sp. B21-007 TaxID=2890407 RepID=UPI001E50BE7A|nr:tail fiber domain-containing protein [Burkholderia sp. B21-007]UEP31303.1 tail fiber domain-containing protein [Burkholderia sp. B21-007]
MANLQKANLGTAPSGSGGDDQRTANTKFNANVDVLSAQAALTTATPITTAQALTASHVGKRVAINIAAGGTVKLPPAASCPADGVIHLRNVGKTILLAVADGSGDSFALTRLNNGEGVLIDTDGAKAWRVLTRGRAYGDDEFVNGALSVGGDVAVSGRLQAANSANLLKNGSGEFGNVGWQTSNFGAAVYAGGDTVFTNAAALANASASDQSDAIPVTAGTPIVFSGEVRTPGMSAGLAELFCNFYNAAGALLASIDLDSRIPAGTVDWVAVRKSTIAPANSASMRVGKYASSATATANGIGFRRIKVEVGSAPSLYSQEGSIAYLGGAPAFSGRPTFGGKVPWDSGNFDPSNYVVRRASNDIASTYFASGTMPNIAGIDAPRYDACLTISNNKNTAASAVVQFHREGSHAAYFGLDTDNYWKVGGRSMGPNAYRIVHEGIDGATLGGWIQVNGARAMAYANYGFLGPAGAGVINASSGNVGVSIHCPYGRIVANEFDAVSDARLKTDIAEIDAARAIEFVRNVDPVTFQWKGDESGAKSFGFIAQWIGKAGFPELLRLAVDERVDQTVDADGWVSPAGVRFSVNYDQVIPIHSSVLRILLKRVDELEARIDAIRGSV